MDQGGDELHKVLVAGGDADGDGTAGGIGGQGGENVVGFLVGDLEAGDAGGIEEVVEERELGA